ncbi:MarR family winged helix-turn-helix transcriptional regulator [Amycolatopsis magusensis]|uniref:MarR family winged helix-turn-helix transcriptional regulator n=1 Tax=Amycolatopsis magusensis TaxID=882444 RepID=UPI0037BDA404
MHTEDSGAAAWRAMLLAHDAALRAIDADLDRAGHLPLTWYDVLLELHGAESGRLRMQDLGERVVLSRTRVSRLVDEMARAGLVEKVRDEQDRRVHWATITDAGRGRLAQTAPAYQAGIDAHFGSHLSEKEKQLLATVLTKVYHAHQRLTLSPPSSRR